jgi:hypothetical protein
MKAVLAVLLGLSLGGCARASLPARIAAPQAPEAQVSQPAREDDALIAELGDEALASARAALFAARESAPTGGVGAVAPEVIHEARIELARQELVEDNLAKQRLDVQEELERELADLQATTQTSKSRVKHASQAQKP